MVLITVTNRWQFPQRFGRIYITKNTVMTLRRMAAGMRESGENPEHLTGAVSAAGRHSGRKSVIEGKPLRRRMDGRFYQPCEPEDL